MATPRAFRLGSTNEDLQGEKFSREFFADLIRRMPPRMPLLDDHDLGKPAVGTFENCRLEPDPEHHGEWIILADLTLRDDLSESEVERHLSRGFSWTATESVRKNCDVPLLDVFLPRPFYADDGVFDSILRLPAPLRVGRVRRKGLESDPVALLVASLTLVLSVGATFTAAVFTPIWTRFYEDHVHPNVMLVLEDFAERVKARGGPPLSADQILRLPTGPHEGVEVVLVPARGHEAASFSKVNVSRAFASAAEQIEAFSRRDRVRRVRLQYDQTSARYVVVAVDFLNGDTVHVIA